MAFAFIKKPMLSATVNTDGLAHLQYPIIVSPKLDGIRCYVHPKIGPVSRKFIPIPNRFVRQLLNRKELYGFDGELMLNDDNGFNSTQSVIMTQETPPVSFTFHVFDYVEDEQYATTPFAIRNAVAADYIKNKDAFVKYVPHKVISTHTDLLITYGEYMSQGYEGIMIRSPDGPYKQGRSTLKQGHLIKYKEFSTAEGSIKGWEPLMRNNNPIGVDNVGMNTRKTRIGGLEEDEEMIGALVLETAWGTLMVGSGLDNSLRRDIKKNWVNYMGQIVTFKYQSVGMLEKPRFPVLLGIRFD